MSFFERIYGKKAPLPTLPETIQNLRQIEEQLVKKQHHLESKMEQETSNARNLASTNRKAALNALKRKRRLEKQLQQIDGTLTTIEYQREALENANTNTKVLKAMKSASTALKITHRNVDLDKVNNLIDDIADQQELVEDISNAISSPVAFGQEFDEDELEKELEALEDEDLEAELLRIPESMLPNAPQDKIKPGKIKKQDDDDDIKLLEKWAT